MKAYIIYILILLIIGEANSLLTKEKREELIKKFTKKITLDSINLEKSNLGGSIKYENGKIQELLDEYNFPQSYNFFNKTGKKPIVKDQGQCGSCWSFASTTALSYRYFQQYNIDVDLSPQEPISCYIKSCILGNHRIDAQLNLIKNGTITEGCLPYTSSNNTVEECPTSCKDGSDINNRYYAKNVYSISINNPDNFYDVVALIIDQLIQFGPVVTSITYYNDFGQFINNENCSNEVYTYDGKSADGGGHAMVIVGYGLLNDKYYWLIQNSYGEEICDKGFVKFGFGEANVEAITFSEPYIKKEDKEISPKEIDIEIDEINSKCNLYISTNSSLDDWISPLKIIFEDSKGENNFSYICGENSLFNFYNGTKFLNCYYEITKLRITRGEYKLKGIESLGNENIFNLDKSFEKKTYIYGASSITTSKNYKIFVSEKGSKIIFQYNTDGVDVDLPPLFLNYNNDLIPLNCQIHKFSFYKEKDPNFLVYCELNEKELNYFEYNSNIRIRYGYYCDLFDSNVVINRLDKTKYPVFRLKHFVVSSSPNVQQNFIEAILIADIEGSISEFINSTYIIGLMVDVEIDDKNITTKMQCEFNSPSKVEKNFIIKCRFANGDNFQKANNFYIQPYYQTFTISSPLEVIIKEPIRNIEFIPEKENSDSTSKDDGDNNDIIFIIIISILGFIILILIFIIVILVRRSKQKDFNGTGPLLKKDEMELKE